MNMHTSVADTKLDDIFALQKGVFSFDTVPTVSERIRKLKEIVKLMRESRDEIVEVLAADFGERSETESLSAEIGIPISAAEYYIKNLKKFARPKKIFNLFGTVPGRTYMRYEPKGVIGVIAPWNYPFQLAVVPALTALAAGNRVIIKPSEYTPHTADFLAKFFGKIFNEDEVAVVTGGPDIGAAFSKLPFDHLFYTGSTQVGTLVATAAAKNLTPVTLELGGKSPCIMMPDATPENHVPLVAFGKFYNGGQTCVAPDYLLVPKGQGRAYAEAVLKEVESFFEGGVNDADFTSIINEGHHTRLTGLVDGARKDGAEILRVSGHEEEQTESNKFAPTVILSPSPDSAVMQQEIFGPVLPILEYETLDDAVRYITERDHPLALYAFGKSVSKAEKLLARTTSGSAVINGSILQVGIEHLSFGGVGKSGYGAYHGERGFREFSHERSVLVFPQWPFLPSVLTPPYGGLVKFIINKTIGK